MMQTAIEKYYVEKMKNTISGKVEICRCDPSHQFLSELPQIVKATRKGIPLKVSQPNTNPNPNRQMHMLKPCDTRTRIICLTNAVQDRDFSSDEKFDLLLDDLTEEGREFGNLVKIVIPRPNQDHDLTPGVGKAFFEYADLDSASRAISEMHRKYFGGNLVDAVYFPESKYAHGDYDA